MSLINSYRSYARSPIEPKIKGVDYDFLNFAVEKSKEYKIDEALNNAKVGSYEYNKNMLTEKTRLLDHEAFYRDKFKHKKVKDSGRKRILVTGGTGFIGSILTERLAEEKDFEVAVLTRDRESLKAKKLRAKGIEVISGHVEDAQSMEKLKGFDIIYHLAVSSETVGERMFDVNVGGTENVLKAAIEGDTRLFVCASSIEAQGPGSHDSIPLKEDHPCNPVSEYGRSKYSAECVVNNFIKDTGLNAVIARIGNVYGIGGRSFIYSISEAILKKDSMLAYLALFQDRLIQPIYIDDLVNSLVHVAKEPDSIGGIYNFTGNNYITAGEWFRIVAAFLGQEGTVKSF